MPSPDPATTDNLQHDVTQWLTSLPGCEAVAEARAAGQATVALAGAFRKRFGPDRAAAILSAAAAQRKAIDKWGPGDWLVTDRGIQQSTDGGIARYKARRVPTGIEILDWCCGVGGEAMHLVTRGPLTAIDCDPVIAVMAQHNLNVRRDQQDPSEAVSPRFPASVVCADVFDHLPAATAWLNIDPDRRAAAGTTGTAGEGRATHCDYLQPPLDAWLPVAKQAAGASVKLAPATQLPEECHGLGEREWISHRGSCRQQVLWLGGTSPAGTIRATVVGSDGSATTYATDQLMMCEPVVTCEAYIFDLDPAVRAAGLSESYAAANGLQPLGGPSGFFTADRGDVDALAHPFQVVWHGVADLKKIRQAVTALQGSVAEVKVRGLDWQPATLIKKLGRRDGKKLTLLASRIGDYCGAVLATR